MKNIILLVLAMLTFFLSMLVLIIALDTVGPQEFYEVLKSTGEQSQFYISTIVVFIISAITIFIYYMKLEKI